MARVRVIPLLTGLVLALLLGSLVLLTRDQTRTLSATFDRTVGVHVGSDVRVMGMRIGRVTAIEPFGTGVRVAMEYDSKYRLPVGVKAVVVAPSVIADRFVQLTPGWTGGPVLASGAVIAQRDTRTPVELDRSLQVTTDLLSALGPRGANRSGALSEAISALAGTMRGTGADTREALRQLAAATDTLGAGTDDLRTTLEQLSGLTGTLAEYDKAIAVFNARLGSVSRSVAGNADQLSTLLETLAGSLGEVAGFVAENRELLATDVRRLAGVTDALIAERRALAEVVDIAPLAFTNLTEAYDPQAQAVRTRANFTEIFRVLDTVVCSELTKQVGDQAAPLCSALSKIVDQLPLRDGFALATPTAPAGSPRAPESGRAAESALTRLLDPLGLRRLR